MTCLPSWDSHFTTDGRMGKRMGALTAQKSCLHRIKFFKNFGPLTPKFTVMVWRPFIRQMCEIIETRSILETRVREWMAVTAEQICTNSHGRRVWSFAWMSFNVRVKGQRLRSLGTKNVLCTRNTHVVWTEWNALLQITSCKQQA